MLGDCRKSPKMAILAISHVIKSMTYKHQIHRSRVFRQSLEISKVLKGRIFVDNQQIANLKAEPKWPRPNS